MSIQQLATQGRERTYSGLAAIDTARLRQMRDSAIRNCFLRFEETTSRIEHVATIHGKEYINDAAARSVNATLYTLHRTSGPIVWIAMADDSVADYAALRSIALRKVHMLVCIGNGSASLHQAFAPVVPVVVDVPDIAAAVQVASRCPVQGAKVIYSPATNAGGAATAEAKTFIHQVNEL